MRSNGLAGQVKQKLIERSLQKKLSQLDADGVAGASVFTKAKTPELQDSIDFKQHSGYRQIELIRQGSEALQLTDPFFKPHQGVAGATTRIDGREFINFSSYNYLDLCGDTRVTQALCAATEQYGSSVSASRMVSGQRPIHEQLEQALASIYQADAALAFVSGHATNVTVIGYLMQAGDLILHDERVHNSALLGAQLAGTARMAFRHNDLDHLEQLLQAHRSQYKRVLILTEGLFSMDGDWPDLAGLVALKREHYAWLMVDEAHSLGVLGERGKGLAAHLGVDPREVDIWMGTLSKSLAGCGGYIAGTQALIDILRYLCPGFLYSVGMPAGWAAATLTALQIMLEEPERTAQLAENTVYFRDELKRAGFDTGLSQGRAIVPLVTGGSVKASRLSTALFDAGINVQPVVYPAVPENQARLRFFISSAHTREHLDRTVSTLAQA